MESPHGDVSWQEIVQFPQKVTSIDINIQWKEDEEHLNPCCVGEYKNTVKLGSGVEWFWEWIWTKVVQPKVLRGIDEKEWNRG